jgi:Zn-dependent protease
MVDGLWYLLALLAGVAGIFVALFCHEFGHSVPVLLAGGSVSISVGSDTGRTVSLGPVTITVGVDGVWNTLHYGYYEYQGTHSKHVRALSALAGPLVTVVTASLLGVVLLYRGTSGPVSFALEIVFISELYRAVVTIVPRTYSREPYAGLPSDGKRFLQIVRS